MINTYNILNHVLTNFECSISRNESDYSFNIKITPLFSKCECGHARDGHFHIKKTNYIQI